jgi:hypothetical protein
VPRGARRLARVALLPALAVSGAPSGSDNDK